MTNIIIISTFRTLVVCNKRVFTRSLTFRRNKIKNHILKPKPIYIWHSDIQSYNVRINLILNRKNTTDRWYKNKTHNDYQSDSGHCAGSRWIYCADNDDNYTIKPCCAIRNSKFDYYCVHCRRSILS